MGNEETVEDRNGAQDEAPEVDEVMKAGEEEKLKVEEEVTPKPKARKRAPKAPKVSEPRGWGYGDDVQLLKTAIRFLAARCGSTVLSEMKEAFPQLWEHV